MGWVRKVLRSAVRPRDHVATPNAECPVCGQSVVVPASSGGDNMMGRIAVRPSEAELTAACRDHGRSPFNDATLRYVELD